MLVYPPLSHRFHDREHFQRVASEYEAFDGVITYGDCIVAMEYKGGYLTLSAKYSGEIRRFLEDFDMKFGRQRKAGIEQLARKLTLMFNADPTARRNIPDLDLRHVTTIFPVLIVQDLALRSRFVNWKARQLFTQEMQGRPIDPLVSVRHLSVITVEELEVLLPFLEAGDFTFADVLCAYAAEYRTPYYQPHEGFQDVLSKFLTERGLRTRINERIMKQHDQIDVSLRQMFNE